MPHQVHLRTLGRVSDHRLSMLRNLAVAVVRYERVKTTEAKAKEVRRLVDRIIGLGRDGSLNARRRAMALTRDRLIVEKTFTDLRERFADRGSGYTRLVRLGHRVGDGAPMMLIELLEGAPAQPKPEAAPVVAEQPRGVRGIARRLRGESQPKAEAPADAATGAKAPQPTAAKRPAKKIEAKKPAAKKPEAKKTEAKKTEAKKTEAKKKAEPKKAAPKKKDATEAKKPAAKNKKGE